MCLEWMPQSYCLPLCFHVHSSVSPSCGSCLCCMRLAFTHSHLHELSKPVPRMFCCLQDPSYPVYVDSSVIMGMTGEYDEGSKGFGKLQYMVCRPENDFFPDLSKVADHCRYMS